MLRGPVIASAQERQKLRRRHAVDQSTSVAPPNRPELGKSGGLQAAGCAKPKAPISRAYPTGPAWTRPWSSETTWLLTNQPCEFTVTAVGEVKVLVLHGARQQLADRRADEQVRQGEIEVELAKRLAKWRAHWSEVQLQRELEASRKAPPEPLTEPLHERRAQSRVPH